MSKTNTLTDAQRAFCKKHKVRTNELNTAFVCSATGLSAGATRYPAYINGRPVGSFRSAPVAKTVMTQYGLLEDAAAMSEHYKQANIPLLVDTATREPDFTQENLRRYENWETIGGFETIDEYLAKRKPRKPSAKKNDSLKVKKIIKKTKTKLSPNVYAIAATKTLKAKPLSSEKFAKSLGRMTRDADTFKAYIDQDTGATYYWTAADDTVKNPNPHAPGGALAKGTVIAVFSKNFIAE